MNTVQNTKVAPAFAQKATGWVWCCRQNPHAVKSEDFHDFVQNRDIITAPYGHTHVYADEIARGIFSDDQARRFVKEVVVGDFVVVPIEGTKTFYLKQVTNSAWKVKTFLDLFDIRDSTQNNNVVGIKFLKNITLSEQENTNLTFEPKKIVYKECRNLGVFDYSNTELSFVIRSLSVLGKNKIPLVEAVTGVVTAPIKS